MTGFGRSSFELQGVGFEVEMRTVNHRHLDTRVRLPRSLADRESDIKTRVQRRLGRGKVDVHVTPSLSGSSSEKLELNQAAADQLIGAARALEQGAGVSGSLDVATLLSFPGVARFVEADLPAAPLAEALGAAVEAALEAVDAMRAAEGASLATELEGRLRRVEELVEALRSRSELVDQAVREKLRKRSAQLARETGLEDNGRLYQEIVIAADRLDVTEELVRLGSHVDQFRAILSEAGAGSPVGRRLEFLLQEMAREANTVGSKANDAPLAHEVVELKTELERIREQVLNVE